MVVFLSVLSLLCHGPRLKGDLNQHSHHHRLQCRDQAEVARSSLKTDRVAAVVDPPLANYKIWIRKCTGPFTDTPTTVI